MKKFTQRLLSLLMLLVVCSVGWASEVTVNDGTSTNSYVPFYGLYVDTKGSGSEFIIPAETEGMDEMIGASISKLTFYVSGSPDSWGSPTIQVYMGEVDAITLSSANGPSAFDIVFTGTLDNTQSTIEVELEEPYLYQGGNLLIGSYVSVKSSAYKTVNFFGVSAPSGSGVYRTSSSGSSTPTGFLPKIKFEYTSGGGIICSKPKNLAAALTPGDGSVATLSWTAGADETAWQICLNDDETNLIDADSNPFQLTGLTPEQAYTAKVRTNCGEEQSAWSSAVSFTPSDAYSVTLNDGTATNDYIPVYGNYAEQFQKNEFILPASLTGLSNLTYGEITKFTFYLSSPAAGSWGSARFRVFMKEINDASFNSSSFIGEDGATIVYEGELDGTQSTMSVVFSEPFRYMGGNLLVGFYETTKGSYKTATFIGISSTNGSINSYSNSSLESITSGTRRDFLPKVTIDYIPGEAPSCLPVSGLSASNIQAHSAVLDWTAGQSESAWKLYYKKTAEEDWSAAINVNALPYTLENLDAATAYQFKVVAVCSDSDDSDASAVASFNTGYAAPFEEKFNASSAPANWAIYSGLLAGVMSGDAELTSASGWSFGTSNNVFDSHARANIYGTSCNKWLVTPAIEVGENMQLSFDLALTVFSSSSSASPAAGEQDDDKFVVLISTDNKQSWSVLRQWDNAGSEYVYDAITNAAEGQFVNIDLSEYAGQGVVIAFYGESTLEGGDNNLHIDNVAIKEIPSCMKPTDLAVDNIGAHSAQLRWSANSGESAWKLFVKKASEADFAEAVVVEENPYILESLDAATSYQFKVVAVCGEENESEESAVASFITDCEALTIDADHSYQMNFDALTVASSYTAPSSRVLPVCWNAINTTTYSSNQVFPTAYYYSYTNYANSAPNSLKFYSSYSSYGSYDPQPQYAILPEMEGLDGKQISLSARGYNASSEIKIGRMSDPADASTFVPFATQALTTSYQEFEFIVPSGEGNYLAIMIEAANSSRTNNGAYIDDIVVSVAPTCAKPKNPVRNYSSIKAHSVELSWTAGDESQTAWEIALSKRSSFNPDETDSIVAVTSNPATINQYLDQNTTYYAYVRANCGSEDGKSLWSSSYVSFTTISGHQTLSSPAVVEGSLGSSSVKINWLHKAANELHQSYEVYYSKLSTRPAELSEDSLFLNVEDTFYVFNNLEPESRYYVWVRDNCGVDGLSDWSYSTNFTTTANCPVPAELSTSNVAARTADIAWNIGEADSYSVQYRVAEGMDGIEEGFEGVSLPSGWTTEGNGTWSVGTGDYSSSTGAHSGSKNAKINHGTSGDETFLVTPSMNLEGKDGCRINLWYVNRAWVSDIDGFGIYYRISGGEWVEIFSTAVAHSDWTQFEGEVPVGALEANCQFGFKFTDGYGYGVSIDDIQIGTIIPAGEWQEVAAESGERLAHLSGLEPETKYEVQVKASCGEEFSESIFFTTTPSCLPISALTLANVDAHAASFTWTASASAETQWQYACVAAGATPESWSLVSATAAVEVSGLSSNTSYDFYVRAYCGADDQGEAIKLNFRTDCETIIIDADHSFSEGFEEVTFVPNCWSSVASESHNWSRTTSNVHSGSGSAHSGYYGDIYLILPDLQIEEDAYLSFWSYNNFVSDYTEAKGARNSVVLLAGESEVELWAAESVSQSQVRTIINLSAYKGQTVSLAFKYEGDNAHDWYIDDVLVSANPSLEITEAGYATYFNADNAYIMPNGVVGHVFSVADGLQEAYESGDIVPANVPLVLQGAQGEYSLIPTVGGESISLANDLIGVNNEMTIVNHADTLYYVLSLNAANEVESVGFYWMNETGAGGFSMPAHKAYLTVYSPGAGAEAEAAPRFYLFHGENNATWLNNLQGVDGTVKFFHNGHFYIMRDHVIYDATGKRVELKYN